MSEEEEVETLEFDIEQLTLGQVSFIEKYTELNKHQLIKELEAPDLMPMSITIALIAISMDPVNPAAATSHAEQMKVVDLP